MDIFEPLWLILESMKFDNFYTDLDHQKSVQKLISIWTKLIKYANDPIIFI